MREVPPRLLCCLLVVLSECPPRRSERFVKRYGEALVLEEPFRYFVKKFCRSPM